MSTLLWQLLSETLSVRIVRYTVARKGYRTRVVYVATTLLDVNAYPTETIMRLYGHRWQIEIFHPYCLHCHSFDKFDGQGLGHFRSAA
jgi:hypothetical protein